MSSGYNLGPAEVLAGKINSGDRPQARVESSCLDKKNALSIAVPLIAGFLFLQETQSYNISQKEELWVRKVKRDRPRRRGRFIV
jgi:hypothetical protein